MGAFWSFESRPSGVYTQCVHWSRDMKGIAESWLSIVFAILNDDYPDAIAAFSEHKLRLDEKTGCQKYPETIPLNGPLYLLPVLTMKVPMTTDNFSIPDFPLLLSLICKTPTGQPRMANSRPGFPKVSLRRDPDMRCSTFSFFSFRQGDPHRTSIRHIIFFADGFVFSEIFYFVWRMAVEYAKLV